jgi:hypothetical protein
MSIDSTPSALGIRHRYIATKYCTFRTIYTYTCSFSWLGTGASVNRSGVNKSVRNVDFYIISLTTLTMSVPDEGYSRTRSLVLNLMSTFVVLGLWLGLWG